MDAQESSSQLELEHRQLNTTDGERCIADVDRTLDTQTPEDITAAFNSEMIENGTMNSSSLMMTIPFLTMVTKGTHHWGWMHLLAVVLSVLSLIIHVVVFCLICFRRAKVSGRSYRRTDVGVITEIRNLQLLTLVLNVALIVIHGVLMAIVPMNMMMSGDQEPAFVTTETVATTTNVAYATSVVNGTM